MFYSVENKAFIEKNCNMNKNPVEETSGLLLSALKEFRIRRYNETKSHS
jgi:hypothetical protein